MTECLFPRPNVQEIATRMKTELSMRLFNGAPIPDGDNLDIISYTVAGLMFELSGHAQQLATESSPQTMCCDNLYNWAALRGQSRKGATRAGGYIALTGTALTIIPPDAKWTSTTGQQYTLDTTATNPTRIQGRTLVKVISISAGSVANLAIDKQLSTSSVITGITMIATTVTDLGGGTDDETCEELRARILAKLAAGVVSTNRAWVEAEILKFAGVTRVCVTDCDSCCNYKGLTIYIFADTLFPETYGVPSPDFTEGIEDAFFGRPRGIGYGRAPIGMDGSINCPMPCPVTITVTNTGNVSAARGEEIKEAISDLFKGVCVGNRICKKDIDRIIIDRIGGQCFGNVSVTFGNECITDEGLNLKLKCGHFPVLAGLILSP